MATVNIPWNVGEGSIVASFSGEGDGAISLTSSVENVSLDREQIITITATRGDAQEQLTVRQPGLREVFMASDGDFILADGGTFNVLKIRPPRVPEGYTEVEYISTNGGQYIDTEYYPNPSSLIRYDVRFTNTNAQYSGNYIAPYCAFGFGASEMEIYFGNGYAPNGAPSTIRQQIVFDFPNGRVLVNGINVYTKTISDTSDGSLILFALRRGSTIENYCYMEMYSCQIYDNDVLVRDYIPAIDSSGEQGLYDLANNTFTTLTTA